MPSDGIETLIGKLLLGTASQEDLGELKEHAATDEKLHRLVGVVAEIHTDEARGDARGLARKTAAHVIKVVERNRKFARGSLFSSLLLWEGALALGYGILGQSRTWELLQETFPKALALGVVCLAVVTLLQRKERALHLLAAELYRLDAYNPRLLAEVIHRFDLQQSFYGRPQAFWAGLGLSVAAVFMLNVRDFATLPWQIEFSCQAAGLASMVSGLWILSRQWVYRADHK